MDSLKPLAQAAPSATTETLLYTTPDRTETTVSSLWICNRGATGTFRVSVSVDGASTANKDYLFYDTQLSANDSRIVVAGITLNEGDVVRAYASTADFSFTMFGAETSP